MPNRIYDCSLDTDLLTGMRLAKVSLGRNELVVVPTDTVYGLAADAIGTVETLQALAEEIPEVANRLAKTFWPGALTMILKSQASLTWDLGETKGTVALRMPDHKIALALLQETGPLAVSSANLTGQPAATTCQQAEEYLGDSVAVYLDGGNSPKGEASTILDLTDLVDSYDAQGNLSTTGKIKIVRRGALSADKIRTIAGDLLEEAV